MLLQAKHPDHLLGIGKKLKLYLKAWEDIQCNTCQTVMWRPGCGIKVWGSAPSYSTKQGNSMSEGKQTRRPHQTTSMKADRYKIRSVCPCCEIFVLDHTVHYPNCVCLPFHSLDTPQLCQGMSAL